MDYGKTLNLPETEFPMRAGLPQREPDFLKFWEENDIFNKSVTQKSVDNSFVFYEGPPSANGLPGIHHVMARAIKDIFCRFQTDRTSSSLFFSSNTSSFVSSALIYSHFRS